MPENVLPHERSPVTIREDIKGRILLTGLHQVNIESMEDLLGALNFGSSIRQTDSTAINAKSSRSHAVFSINLVQRRNKAQAGMAHEKRFSVPLEAMTGAESWVTIDSKLHFVDLAGSERLKNTGASGDRAKEGISINGGLASLGKVISQLSSRHPGSHVSYRDSKLTRLLQDSLGGNAVTYMIACVTPAEFHLSETLNTVQYAQRARAIQSKPRIQQIADDSDKQAIIDRLRAEVSFLRDQIRSAERRDRPSGGAPQERIDRQNDREIELQNHLLDMQENYAALNQRHAKLITEITKARDNEVSDTPTLTGAIGDSAVERLKRSNSFAEAVEQVVLEYEKTIQSLETSLSKTRSSLSATESSLLERETKCAYIETVNQQLQNRVQKLMDREASTENYLRDLESRIDGQSSGEEKNSAVVGELRKEIARIRENEASCEEYISTLEERLAETDQDMELMQREVDRLEHVVERQRSIGKLDTLLYEFDHLQQSDRDQAVSTPQTPPSHAFRGHQVPSRSKEDWSHSLLQAAISTPIPESDDHEDDSLRPHTPTLARSDKGSNGKEAEGVSSHTHEVSQPREKSVVELQGQIQAQSKFMADKLESVTQELFDLQVEHEATVNEYDLMAAKYEEALRTLAELQDAADEARHPVVTSASIPSASFLGDARVNELKGGGQSSSSRSLLSELSLVGDSIHPSDEPAYEISEQKGAPAPQDPNLLQEIQELKRIQAEKDLGMATLNNQYLQLQELHLETLDLIEELKMEVQKAKLYGHSSSTSPTVRRKASQSVMTIDRAHRSLASLRNIAAENLEHKPETMRNVELNINTAMHELHQRSERVEALEAELSSIRKELEGKMTIISGLARERSSLKGSSPMDISVVYSMQNQLSETENQMKMMQDDHIAREQELLHEIESLQDTLNQAQVSKSGMPGVFPETPAASLNESDEKQLQEAGAQGQEISRLHDEVRLWQQRHTAAVESLQAAELQFRSTIEGIETSLASEEVRHHEASNQQVAQDDRILTLMRDLEKERSDHAEIVRGLREQINGHKLTVDSHVNRISELERLHLAAREEIENGTLNINHTQSQLDAHREQISILERQLEDHKSAVEFHKHGLRSLHDSHAQALEETRSATLAEAKSSMESQLRDLEEELNRQHQKKEEALIRVIESANHQLKELVALHTSVESEGRSLEEQSRFMSELVSEIKKVSQRTNEETASMKRNVASLEAAIAELRTSHEESIAEMQRVKEEKEKATRLVDELEDQLYTTYNQHQATSSRLSLLNSSRDQALQDANAVNAKLEEDLEIQRVRVAQLEVRLHSPLSFKACCNEKNQAQYASAPTHLNGHSFRERSDSLNSTLRKSASVASLPSPPPAIPLPPLPTNAPGLTSSALPANSIASYPIKDDTATAQYAEDQEARIRTIEKHLLAEKQLTATLEEALIDLESQGTKFKADMELWKKKAWSYEDELATLRKERNSSRYSVQAVEEERNARREAEAAKAHLEERMAAISKKKKKSQFNCF